MWLKMYGGLWELEPRVGGRRGTGLAPEVG